jgi:hypothetical protein
MTGSRLMAAGDWPGSTAETCRRPSRGVPLLAPAGTRHARVMVGEGTSQPRQVAVAGLRTEGRFPSLLASRRFSPFDHRFSFGSLGSSPVQGLLFGSAPVLCPTASRNSTPHTTVPDGCQGRAENKGKEPQI